MRTFALDTLNFASLLAITALIFLFLVVLGLGRPAFAAATFSADHMHASTGSSRVAGVMQQQLDAFQS